MAWYIIDNICFQRDCMILPNRKSIEVNKNEELRKKDHFFSTIITQVC